MHFKSFPFKLYLLLLVHENKQVILNLKKISFIRYRDKGGFPLVDLCKKSISETMSALVFNGTLQVEKVPVPRPKRGEALIKVDKAGICNTDFEIIKGYIPGFNGVLGHEFIGTVVESDEPQMMGKRVTAEINCSCGECEFCKKGLSRHCSLRTVIGIINRNGAFAEYIVVPETNIFVIPDQIPDSDAIFIEPLAAALEIIDQVKIPEDAEILILGDGKLGLLISFVMKCSGYSTTMVGKHREKLSFAEKVGVSVIPLEEFKNGTYDLVIEATGNSDALEMAIENTKPRGIVVLKSTYAGDISFNPSKVVVDEISIVGSRCGRFEAAINFLSNFNNRLPLSQLINQTFSLDQATEAFEYAQNPEILKTIINVSRVGLET